MAQDVFSKMAEDNWVLNEDGYLNIDTEVKEIIYHPSLNVILICTPSGLVRVLDVNSGVILQSSSLSAQNLSEVKCKYIPTVDRVLFCDGQCLGVRSDYNGVLLLDSILQKTISDSKEEVTLELPLSEAIILKQSLTSGSNSGYDHVINELTEVITKAQKYQKKSIKALKWNTVCLHLPLEDIRSAASSTVSNLLLKNQHIPELGVASAIQERLSELLGEKVNASDRPSMASESRRRETYSHWPHMDYKWALPDQMAQAGFYHQPNASGDDRAMCFTCTVCLVCWERTDEPWSEHERHAPNCPFVIGEYTQNVPLSVTLATCPAADVTFRGSNVKEIGNSSIPHLLPTYNADGLISVFDVSSKVKRTHSFYVTQFDSHILEKFTQDFIQSGIWSGTDTKNCPVTKNITALSIMSDKQNINNSKSPRSTILCGLNISCELDKSDSNIKEDNKVQNIQQYLVVYDFMYCKDQEDTQYEILFNSNPPADLEDSVYPANIYEGLETVEPEEVCGYNLMKQLSTYYKTFIPGESDEVFLPPTIAPKKIHTGTKIIYDAYDPKNDTFFSNNYPPNIIPPNNLETNEQSISDHIAEVKNNSSNKILNYPRAAQCVTLPTVCRECEHLEISDIFPTYDNKHMLVVLKGTDTNKSFLILYAIDFSDRMCKIVEEPVMVRELESIEKPEEIRLLPILDKFPLTNPPVEMIGNAVMVCADGAVRIMNLETLKIVCYGKINEEKFVSAVYCNSLDRLCASTKNGSLHFFALNNADNESGDDHDEDELLVTNMDSTATHLHQVDHTENTEFMKYFQKSSNIIDLTDLKMFKQLCEFEPLKSGYCVVVPPCWSEFQQALRQRRQPQTLKGEGEQLMKTWRLQTDTTTWDEHLFEITLPTPTPLGHVDMHYTLQPSSTLPHVEVTLLKQNKNGIRLNKDVQFSVDEGVTIDMLQLADNPVTTQEYLRSENVEILAGPIAITSHLDLTEQSGIITLTSPKLFKSKLRNMVLHIRAVNSRDEANKCKSKRPEKNSNIDKLGVSSRKTEFYMGCDVIHELSITMHSFKQSEGRERTLRHMMLESNVFIQSLILTAISSNTNEVLSLVLDILDWIASVRLTRNRSNGGEAPNQQCEFIKIIEENLTKMMTHCLLHGGRSLTHKCVRLIMTCCSGAENISKSCGEQFSSSILNSIFTILDNITNVKSAAGLHWLFSLLLKVTTKDTELLISSKCVTLLNKISTELLNRVNPYHLLLRSRYGLYGTPMEAELFDIEPPPYVKGDSSLPYLLGSNQNSVEITSPPATENVTNYSFNKETISPKDVLFTSTTKLKYKNVASLRTIHGLIETEPLHFTCVSSSEGTRLEKADTSAKASYINSVVPLLFSNNDGPPTTANKKDDVQLQQIFNSYLESPKYHKVTVYPGELGSAPKTFSVSDVAGSGGNDWLIEIFKEDQEELRKKVQSDDLIDWGGSVEPTSTSSSLKPLRENIPHANSPCNSLPWQQLLVVPPKQVIVVERMHSGARRYITIDFGKPVLLTDIFIPSCADLVTVTIDIWLKGEDIDETRLVVAMDIGSRNLLLTDLQHPPLCRFMKITVVGRYGMSTIRCRIPLGYFYGHLLVLPEEVPSDLSEYMPTLACTDLEKQLNILSKLFEDISCRYSLACSKLKELLQPFLVADMKNAIHLATYMNILKDRNMNINNVENNKIFSAYQETIRYQHQLNMIKNIISRIEGSLHGCNQTSNTTSSDISTDKLTSIAGGLLEVLLSIEASSEMSRSLCQKFFQGLCISQPSRLQLLAAIFLEKSCGRSSFWGDFLADTLAETFSTACTMKFPQDRLFILLSYLSRKSSEKSAVIDAALRVLYDTLKPILQNRKSLLAVTIDLPLLSWQLMYLSLQLSLCKSSVGSANRWNWVLGEMIGKSSVDNSKFSGRKKPGKRVATSSNSNYIPSNYNSMVMNAQNTIYQPTPKILHSKTETSWQGGIKEISKINKILKKRLDVAKQKDTKEPQPVEKSGIVLKTPQFIDNDHCLAVAKALLQLILVMDHSSSADMMLLCFKVISKLVTLAKLKLGQLLTECQLLDLIHVCISCKIPWAPFALACFLQDILELSLDKSDDNDDEMETETSLSMNWPQNEIPTESEGIPDNFNMEGVIIDSIAKPPKIINTLGSLNLPPLPSVYESEDSDFEELLEDLQKVRCTTAKVLKSMNSSNSSLSCAMDSRLELGVQSSSEVAIKKLVIRNTQLLLQNIAADNNQKESNNGLHPWPISPEPIRNETSSLSNHKMLTYCFSTLFDNLQNQDPIKIEHILQLWLTLNCPNKNEQFTPSTIPQIILNCSSVNYLISAMAWTPGLSLVTWCVALQTLTLVCNMNNGKKWFDLSGMANTIVNHPDFVQLFLSLLSGTGPIFSGKVLAGPSLCKALHDFLVRLQMRCDIVSSSSKLGNQLKTLLLKVVYQLAQPSGSIASRLGPLDAQGKLLQTMLYLDYTNTDLSIAMSTLESTASLVLSYVQNKEKIKCISIGEKQNVMTTTFNDILGSVFRTDSNKQDRSVTYEDLLILMLKLLGKLVQTPLPDQLEAMDTESPTTSQTDETKAEQIQHDNTLRHSSSTPSFADIVLEHHPTVIRLCRCLAACKSSSLCMLANVSQKVAFSNLSEPNTVGDAIFHLLALLAKKASKKEMLMQPLLMFLSQTPTLSEPLLWFILQVLDHEDSIKLFYNAGGITVLGTSIVNSCNSPSTLSGMGTIATVMQHFSGVNTFSDAHAIISSASSTKKVMQASVENKALQNFAPFCTITCESGTAQPADVLIQGLSGVTNRRARTPLWSYHFYPEEVHTELILHLPSAVLLKEVQLQPHAGSLATSPSYVALEVSANGPSRLVPACPPLPTSGLTYIRLHLPVPKVVNCVLIRLYKPRDANSIGLLQIRLLGTHAFGGSITQSSENDDELHCKHSLGWLRLLHHCFTLVNDTQIRNQIIECASQVQDLLTTCCNLLLVPSHILPIYLPCLEKVLRELALYSSENGFHAINVLLDSRSGAIEPLMAVDSNWQDRLINVTGYQSACELLYQICEHQDLHTPYRVKIILQWLESTAKQALLTNNISGCNAAYISSIASILWSAKQLQVQYDIKSLITTELFNNIYNLKNASQTNISLKYSLDSLLCSICYIKSEFFPILLQKIGVLVPNLSTDHQASISDDRKDSESMTDDSKRSFETNGEWYGHLVIGQLSNLNLTREQLETIALVSRSPTATQQLLDSGLPKLLNSAILEFCHANNKSEVPMASLENVASILQFFTDVSDEKTMRDWLGSEDGSFFWLHLLQWLCKKPENIYSNLQTETHVNLEEVCVKFLSKCCLCHTVNQNRLAKVLCDVIYLQSSGISGFLRRLILQLLLENEKIPVSIEADETLYKSTKLTHAYIPAHPAFKQTYNRAMLCLSTSTTLLEILEQYIFFNSPYKSEAILGKKTSTTKKDVFKSWFTEESDLSMAAGVTAKDKRAKDIKNHLTSTPQSKKKRYTSDTTNGTDNIEGRLIKCETFSDQPLPLTITLGQLLRLIESKGNTTDWPYIHLKIFQCKNSEDKNNSDLNTSIFQQQPICSALQVFSSMGGLALLAQHLPTIYPETIRSTSMEKSAPDQSDSDWIKVDDCDDIYEDIIEDTMANNSPSKSGVLISQVPAHSLTAFGLFLRLPGYAEVLLKDMKRALCLLRLVLGVTDDGEGGDIFHSTVADTLPTLPFEVLKTLYDATPLSTDDGRVLRRLSINLGIVHMLLACLGIFTHQSNNNEKDGQNNKKEDRSQLYWAKGTGYGTGSTQQSWNVEQALLKQRNEEEHVTVLLQVLASYINPNDEGEDELKGDVLPPNFSELLAQSALLPAISSYLRNDSVLDMARHIPLYKAVLQLLRALAVSTQLISLLLPQKNRISEPSVTSLLKNMKSCVDTYASKLRINTKSKSKSKLGELLEELEQGEGLATLIPDIQVTTKLVTKVTSAYASENDSLCEIERPIDSTIVTSMEEQYLRIMKYLQFSSYEMITELPEGGLKFVVSHHFENNVKSTSDQSHPGRVKRIAQEAVTLSSSLPLSYSSSVFVRYDTSRLDVMKVLITGPADTSYANGCFEFDVFFPSDYPLSPMMINFETTGHHTVRFNPNLYNDGKVCLSVLNTWHGRPEEKWNPQTSSFLQVLVSIQSLILVPEPYFNEPGYERARGTPAGTVSCRDYNLNICQATVRWAMLEAILNPCECFKEVIYAHFYIKRNEILAQVEKWISEVEQDVVKEKKTTRTNKKSPTNTLDNFKKVYHQLKDALMKLKPPPELEEDEESPVTPTNHMEVTIDVHQTSTEKDLEKMVADMCE